MWRLQKYHLSGKLAYEHVDASLAWARVRAVLAPGAFTYITRVRP
jgi:hypothetical protein